MSYIRNKMRQAMNRLNRNVTDSIEAKHNILINIIEEQQSLLKNTYEQVREINERLNMVASKNEVEQAIQILSAQRDDIPRLISQLQNARKSPQYKAAYADNKPLVTVRIATYNKVDELINKCIPSVLGQTYKNIEVIIVGDHCTDDTEKRINSIRDKRIKFINLKNRNRYPSDPRMMWYVAGSPGMNIGANMATGLWIAPLDDDDEFTKDHIENLIELARNTKAELNYGALIQRNLDNNTENIIYSETPDIGKFSFQAAIYPSALNFFQYDQQSWVVREPGDWNLCRRMLLSGVTYASTKDVVGYLNMNEIFNKKHYKERVGEV